MNSEMDCNPSPPPDILRNYQLMPDRIGCSVYSKKWVYQILMNIVQFCEKPPHDMQEVPNHDNSIPVITDESTQLEQISKSVENKTVMMELDPKIEEDACTLWDMSADKDVAEFLNETGVLAIILDIVDKTKSPRLLEIVIGILGNISSVDSICKSISENEHMICTILQLSGTSDTPTLLQVFRVILCGVRNQNYQDLWFEAFEENSFFFENLKFIFYNSLSRDVINGTYQVLHSIVNENVEYCKMWGRQPYVNSIIVAGKLLLTLGEKMDNFFSVLNALCQYQPNINELVDHWEELNQLFTPYFLNLEEEESLPDYSRVAALFSSFDTYNSLLKCENMKQEYVSIDVDVLKAMSKLACSVNSMVLNVRKNNLRVVDLQNPPDDDDPGRQFLQMIEERDGRTYITMLTDRQFYYWTVLGEAIVDTAKILHNYTEKENEKEILDEISNLEVMRQNIGVLII